jgi:hypothetical protein
MPCEDTKNPAGGISRETESASSMAQVTAATVGHTGDLKAAGFKDTAIRKGERESRHMAMSLPVPYGYRGSSRAGQYPGVLTDRMVK